MRSKNWWNRKAGLKRHEREIDDDTGSFTYHYEFGYDSTGRLNYYYDHNRDSYDKISYPFYGKLTEKYNAQTGKLTGREMQEVNDYYGLITITTESERIVLTPLEKGSRLYKLKSVFKNGDFPLVGYWEIVYR